MQSFTIPADYLSKLQDNVNIRFVVLKDVSPELGDFKLEDAKGSKQLVGIIWRYTVVRFEDILPEDLTAWDDSEYTELLTEMKNFYGKSFKDKDDITVLEFNR